MLFVSGICRVIELYVYMFFFRFLSLLSYYKTLNIVPCAMWSVLVVYLF